MKKYLYYFGIYFPFTCIFLFVGQIQIIELSPEALLASNPFVCEVCNKGFSRDQNLQLHRRGHNLPWKLKTKAKNEPYIKKLYICPNPDCTHHHPDRALGDLTGIKKHYGRKHGEKKYPCEKCGKMYAVQSDMKAHLKICGTKKYTCRCGTIFSRFVYSQYFFSRLLYDRSCLIY